MLCDRTLEVDHQRVIRTNLDAVGSPMFSDRIDLGADRLDVRGRLIAECCNRNDAAKKMIHVSRGIPQDVVLKTYSVKWARMMVYAFTADQRIEPNHNVVTVVSLRSDTKVVIDLRELQVFERAKGVVARWRKTGVVVTADQEEVAKLRARSVKPDVNRDAFVKQFVGKVCHGDCLGHTTGSVAVAAVNEASDVEKGLILPTGRPLSKGRRRSAQRTLRPRFVGGHSSSAILPAVYAIPSAVYADT